MFAVDGDNNSVEFNASRLSSYEQLIDKLFKLFFVLN